MTAAARLTYSLAAHDAESLGAPAIDREHLFIGLCKADAIADVRDGEAGLTGDERAEAQKEATDLLHALSEGGVDPVRSRRRTRELWLATHPVPETFSGHRTPECRAIFTTAESRSPDGLRLAALLSALVDDPGALVDQVLDEQQVDKTKLAAVVKALIPATPPPDSPARWGRDLMRLAREGQLHAAFGRDTETKQVARILMQAGKNSPLLVGEAGVGKTAIVEGLAYRLSTSSVPAPLKDVKIVEVSLGSLVAGTTRRGEFEERVQRIIKAAEADNTLVIFIDEIHMLLGAGAAQGGMDAAGLLKPALARGTLRCIGATTTAEYRRYIESDAALARRFQVISVEEPTRDQTIAILRGIRPKLEKHYDLTIADEALEAGVDLSIKYLPELRLPDKAIDVINQACSRVVLSTFSPRGEACAPTQVGRSEVVTAVAERCRVPVEQVTAGEADRLLQMEDSLRARVIGQDAAVTAVANTIRTARAGLRHPRRPVGVFLLLGPTGTGKTELARAVAATLFGDENRLIRLDMSEFAEKHQVARLVGAPPGYLGHDRGGQLTEAIRTTPYAVVLFDEVDKAHPDVHALFLQIFDEGTLTDGHGRVASFREAVIFLTANFAAEERQGEAIGFVNAGGSSDADEGDQQRDQVGRLFRPEIVNRIDRVLTFAPLRPETMRRITEKILRRTNAALADRDIVIELTPSARELIALRGYSAAFGARVLERAFRTLVEEPIGRLILEGRVKSGDRIAVDESGGRLTFAGAGL